MRALVYHGPGQRAFEERPEPRLSAPTDAVVRITHTTICGTDLHILHGDVPSVDAGRILGHEGVGIIEQVGTSVLDFKVGDQVLISCISSCGRCVNCRKGMPSHCMNGGGWILGNLIDGTQAERVLIPFADHSLYTIPNGTDEIGLVMLSDILPTGFECGVLSGCMKPGDSVAIIGAGPIGLATLLTAQFYTPAEIFLVDVDDHRLEWAKKFGATRVINNSDGLAVEKILAMTGGRGVDVAIEAIGHAASFDICQAIVAAGGHIANIGVHGKPVQLDLQRLWSHNITLTTRLVDAVSTQMLIKEVGSGRLDPRDLITHHFTLDQIMEAYDTFGQAMDQRALKVIISNGP
ncbi:MAG: zinc-dependent alcohol dehydrogenase family protein [Acidobacteria bacterium]|nr:zinc-dependent alcohol dehydrogenase family protein [Acidobacteriota bacterium]MBI3487200.1 zinc-dependent alcohol dehydrogenase family protein [Acidobacteriota bacterium]